MKIESKIIASGYDRKTCWAHARCGIIPNIHDRDEMIVTMQKSYMSTIDHVHDIFSGIYMMRSEDGGDHWTNIVAEPHLARWKEGDVDAVVCDFASQWHEKTSQLLGIGSTCRYRKGQTTGTTYRRETAYSVFDHQTRSWNLPRFLEMPDAERFRFAGAGCPQWVDLPNGEILLPIYFVEPKQGIEGINFSAVVLRCGFDGETLSVLELGDVFSLPIERGFAEPSLIACNGQYWLTLRNDLKAYLAVSSDGLRYDAPQPWTFDDGKELGSCNTQQHWMRLEDRLFLIYTRSGLDNDHIARNRAPLLMSEVDREQRVLLRETEQILVPNRGAQLGNFGVVQRSDTEAWVCVSEWMENSGAWNRVVWSALERKYPEADLSSLEKSPGRCRLCELSGSDNSIYLVKISL